MSSIHSDACSRTGTLHLKIAIMGAFCEEVALFTADCYEARNGADLEAAKYLGSDSPRPTMSIQKVFMLAR